jgi:hypothetical protein
MPNTTTLNETVRTLDGTEWVRLATPGANWRAQISAIETFFQAALTTANDTNVTITASVNPTTCLINPATLTMGWTGSLAVGRGGTGDTTLTANGVLYGNGTSNVLATTAATANQVLWGGAAGGAPSFTGSPVVTLVTAGGNPNTQAWGFEIDPGGNSAATFGGVVFSTTNTIQTNLTGYKSNNNTLGVQTAMGAGANLLQINANGSDGAAFQASAQIIFQTDAAFAANSAPGRIVFATTKSGAISTTTALIVDSSQQVGINMTPANPLDVMGTARCQTAAAGTATQFFMDRGSANIAHPTTYAAGDWAHFYVYQDNAAFQRYFDVVVNGASGSADGRFRLFANSGGSAATEHLRVDGGAGGVWATNVNNSTGGLGYGLTGNGDGGTVTQATSRTTGVTLSKICGAITIFSAAGVVASTNTFTVTNTLVQATDTVIVSVKSGTNTYAAWATAIAAGTFNISLYDLAGTATDAPVINFAVIKAVTT